MSERIIAELCRPFDIAGHQLHIGCSIGIALAPNDIALSCVAGHHFRMAVDALSAQVQGLINDNPNLNPVLEQLHALSDLLVARKDDLAQSLRYVGQFAASPTLRNILGQDSPNSIRRTRLNGERLVRRWRKMASAVSRSGSWPGASAMKALGTASRIGSGDGTTAASATAACSMSTLSSSNGLMR